jgi:[ribosomal protein S5]-alanine N-acetyltransferase
MIVNADVDVPALRNELVGVKVLLRPFAAGDITEAYLGWLRDQEVVRFSNQRFVDHTVESCQAYLASFSGTANQFLSVCDRDTGQMLGTITVYRNLHHQTADIGIMVGERKVWGQGIGAEAFCLVLSALEGSGQVRKITAGTLSVNHGMVQIMKKANMQHEATRKGQELFEGEPVDVVYYATFCND